MEHNCAFLRKRSSQSQTTRCRLRSLIDIKMHSPRRWANPFYYRILSPVILIEFDHVPGIVYDNDTPSRDHIHTVVRTPNGNDYGKDLLRQHYAQHNHSHPMTAHLLTMSLD